MRSSDSVLALLAFCWTPLVDAATSGSSNSSDAGSGTTSATTSDSGVGAAIVAGLGGSITTTSSSSTDNVSSLSSSAVASSSIPSSITSMASAMPPSATLSSSNPYWINTSVGAMECQSSLVSYDYATMSILGQSWINTSFEVSTTYSDVVEYGTADVYTTLSGFPRAHGNITITSASTFLSSSTTTYSDQLLTSPASLASASLPPAPRCIIGSSDCISMESSYYSSLSSAQIAASGTYTGNVYPPPDNSPRCYEYTRTCSYAATSITSGCTIFGSNVKVFYWPTSTPAITKRAQANNTASANPPAAAQTTVVDGITMTSPTMYLSFDQLYAMTSTRERGDCNEPNDAPPGATPLGGTYNNSVFSIMPKSVSTLEKAYYALTVTTGAVPFPDDAIAAMRSDNVTEYEYWAQLINFEEGAFVTSQVNLDDFAHPNPRAYYVRAYGYSQGSAFGCYSKGPHPACSTIFEGDYLAQLAVPLQVRNLDPAWANCDAPLQGVHDPPIALTAATSAAGIDTPTTSPSDPITTSASPSPSPASPTVQVTSAQPQFDTLGPKSSQSIGPAAVQPSADPIASDPPKASDPSTTQSTSAQVQAPQPQPDSTTSKSAQQLPRPSSQPVDPSSSQGQGNPPASQTTTPQVIVFSAPATPSSQSSAQNALQALTQTTQASSTQGQGPVAVFTADGSVLTASSQSGNIVVAGTTIPSGGVATIQGATLSNAVSAVIIQPAPLSTTNALPPVITTSQNTPLASIGGEAVSQVSAGAGVAVGSQTLTQGQVTTLSGTLISVGSTAVIIGSSTIGFTTAAPVAVIQQSATAVTVSIKQGSSELDIGTIKLSLAASALSEATTPGSHLATIVETVLPAITVGSSTISQNSKSQFVIGSQTLQPGSSAVIVSGTTYSLATSASYVVVNGKTSSLAAATTQTSVLSYYVPGQSTSSKSPSTSSSSGSRSTASSMSVSSSVPAAPTLAGGASSIQHSGQAFLIAFIALVAHGAP